MLDIAFLLAPAFERHVVYRYRSGILRHEMGKAVTALAAAHGHLSFSHSPREYAAALTGLFEGLHWTDVGDARLSVVEGAMQAMLDHRDGPTAIFVPASSSAFRSATWRQLEQEVMVIDEPLAVADSVDAIVRFALQRSDLSPPEDFASNNAFRTYLLARIERSSDLGDTLGDIDDYILTRLQRTVVASNAIVSRVPESSLTRALSSFLRSPGPAETSVLLTQVLLRGEDDKLALGALSISTVSLLKQYQSNGPIAQAGEVRDALMVWTSALLAAHAAGASLREGYAPSWRGIPDIRAFAVMDLCRDYRAGRRPGDQLDGLVERAVAAVRSVPVLLQSDERVCETLITAALDLLSASSALPKWCADLAAGVEAAASTQIPPPMRFDIGLASISDQPIVVDHLRRCVAAGSLDEAVLFHGPTFEDRERIASAYAKAAICATPIQGDACGTCSSCATLENGSSPHCALARLRAVFSLRAERSASDDLADIQVREVRRLIFQKSLWHGRRVVILDGVDQVRKGALDRLLKAIEESPPLVTFVFLAERLARVPAALRSRSTILKLKPPSTMV